MSSPKEENDRTTNPMQDGLKVLGWIVLLLGILTLFIGLPLTSLGF
jgi:hypothetical protein